MNMYTIGMTTIKTAISIEESLFRQIEEEAAAKEISRSGLISVAIEEYFARREVERVTAILNEVYADGPTSEEKEELEAMWRYHVKLLKDDPL